MDGKRDITGDLLLCNRCGACRAVCPVFDVYREEWAAARGKVELAEAWFRGDRLDERRFQEIFDLCLHCMTCEENCPPGMRAGEVVMAVRAEMGKKGLIPRAKKVALRALRRMDPLVFKGMRIFGLSRKAPVHGYGAKSPLSALFPLLGWPRERIVPMPARKPFLGNHPEFFPASASGGFDLSKDEELVRAFAAARERNLREGKSACFYLGHAVNHFFPEEAEAAVRVLNLLGIDVHVPKDQPCCGAPFYYAGDIDGARKAALDTIEKIAPTDADWIVTTCSSGGLMLKREYPRILGIDPDGFFGIEWDAGEEVFVREKGDPGIRDEHRAAGRLYAERIAGKIRDINELIAEVLGLAGVKDGYDSLFGMERGAPGPNGVSTSDAGSDKNEKKALRGEGGMQIVTYHHPCHLNRGQGISWQPERILELLPGYRYVRMPDADKCCGGGGAFTFTHSEAAERIAGRKAESIAAVDPDVVATACPVCRIQLVDTLGRSSLKDEAEKGKKPRMIRVASPVELLLEELSRIPLKGLK